MSDFGQIFQDGSHRRKYGNDILTENVYVKQGQGGYSIIMNSCVTNISNYIIKYGQSSAAGRREFMFLKIDLRVWSVKVSSFLRSTKYNDWNISVIRIIIISWQQIKNSIPTNLHRNLYEFFPCTQYSIGIENHNQLKESIDIRSRFVVSKSISQPINHKKSNLFLKH